MRKKMTSKETKVKAVPAATAKVDSEEKLTAVESGTDTVAEMPVAVEAAPVEKVAAPIPAAKPDPIEAVPAAAKVTIKDEKSAKKRSIRKSKETTAEPVKKPRVSRKAKAERGTTEKVAKRTSEVKTAAEKEPNQFLPRRSKVEIPAALGLYVQYQGGEVDMAAIAETAKAEFKAANKRGRITSLKIYLKPEDHTAYYVINDDFQGQVSF